MAAGPTGNLMPFLLVALTLAAGIGIFASYVMPHQQHDITGGGGNTVGTVAAGIKPGG